MALPNDWIAQSRDRLNDSGFDVELVPGASAIHGPARLPLSASGNGSWSRACLWYAEYPSGRFVLAVTGDPRTEDRTTVRIESACLFGHVFASEQCDCGWQWRTSLAAVLEHGGVLVYAVDQDARGLGIAAHFDVYQLRQQELLDTAAVFERLDAPWDNRDYTPVLELLRAVGVQRVRLLSNNRERVQVLQDAGFDVERAPAEAALTVANMSTLMLEKEDLGYEWSFATHADLLEPLQARVESSLAVTAGALARAGGPLTAEVVATWDSLAEAIVAIASGEHADNVVLYLTDLPRLEDLSTYEHLGVQVLVVPYPTLPSLLIDACDERGIRLVDWSRRNRWERPRPQWVPVSDDTGTPQYVRVDTDFHLPPPPDAERLVRRSGASA
jgi:GTP cyclohydrolase II